MWLFKLIGKLIWIAICICAFPALIIGEMLYLSGNKGGSFFNPFSFKAWKERL